jgi:hypothetical protein
MRAFDPDGLEPSCHGNILLVNGARKDKGLIDSDSVQQLSPGNDGSGAGRSSRQAGRDAR